MAYVFVPPPQPSRKAKELGAAIANLILEYQKHEGIVNGTDLRMAQQVATSQVRKANRGQGGSPNAAVVIALVGGLVLALGVLVYVLVQR